MDDLEKRVVELERKLALLQARLDKCNQFNLDFLPEYKNISWFANADIPLFHF